MMIEQTYDETIINFMVEQGVFLPQIADMSHAEFCSCIGVSRDGVEWSFVNRRNITRIEADFDMPDIQARALWDAAYRTKTRPGRVIRKLYLCAGLPEPRAEEIAEIVRRWELYIGLQRNDYSFELLQGEMIRWAYLVNNNVENDNGLHCSCMNRVSCQPYLDIYAKNPKQIQLAVLMQGGLVAARALVWDKKYYDRIYSADNYTMDLLREHCEFAGLIDCYEKRGRIDIELSRVAFDSYPYIDTFCYIDMDNSCACNYEPDGHYRACCSQHGTYDEHNGERDSCAGCGEYIGDDYYHIGGDTYCSDCVCYSERYDEHILRTGAVYCEGDDDYINIGDSHRLYNGDYAYYKDCIELYNGSYALDGDCDVIELHNGEYALCDDEDIVCTDDCDTYAHIDECVKDYADEWQLREDCVKIDGEYYNEDITVKLYDGRRVHEDNAVSTYNGLIADVSECTSIKGGAWALCYDPIVQFDKMSRAERESLSEMAA